VLLERLIAVTDWRTAWAVEGLLVWAVVLPPALLGMHDRPADLGQFPDGAAPPADAPLVEAGVTRAVAMRTGFFWVVTAAVAVSGMLSTAVAFHQISLLGERGLTPAGAAANFLPQTAAGLLATLATGALVDRVNPRWLVSGCMLALAGGLVWGVLVTPGWPAVGFGLTIGAAGGSIRALEAAAFPRVYGTAHLGSIRGFVMAVSVGSTAFGPLLFALVFDAAGSYAPALLSTALLPVLVAAAALLVTAAPDMPGARDDALPRATLRPADQPGSRSRALAHLRAP
jgi:cyanate permease